MQSVKTFFITFLSSVCIVLVSFAVLYWFITPSQQPAGAYQQGVPITNATSADNKTCLVSLQQEENQIFFIIKLNAVDRKVSVTAVPADYYISHSSRTLQDSFSYAGIMQCVQDISLQLDIPIDYHLVLVKDTLPDVTAELAADLPLSQFFSLSPDSAAALISDTIQTNLAEIQTVILPHICENLTWMHTNIGKTQATAIDRILTLLQRSGAEYMYSVAD